MLILLLELACCTRFERALKEFTNWRDSAWKSVHSESSISDIAVPNHCVHWVGWLGNLFQNFFFHFSWLLNTKFFQTLKKNTSTCIFFICALLLFCDIWLFTRSGGRGRRYSHPYHLHHHHFPVKQVFVQDVCHEFWRWAKTKTVSVIK